MSSPQRLFVVGAGRSGTSLLHSMLGTHPGIAALPETGFLRQHVLSAAARPLDAATLRRHLAADDRFARLDIDIDRLIEAAQQTPAETGDRAARPLALRAYDAMLDLSSAAWVCDKDPRSVEQSDVLAALWPGCRIVHIHRDPRAVLASKQQAAWSSGQGSVRQVIASSVQYRLGRYFGRTLGPDIMHSVSYEELIASPVAVLTRLCNWLGIPFEQQMLAFGDTARELVATDEMAWKRETLGPLLSDNANKWTATLTPRDIALAECACRQAMLDGAHARHPVPPAVSPLSLLPARLAGTLLRFAGIDYAWKVRHRNRRLIRHLQS